MWIFSWIKISWHSCCTWDKLGWLNLFWKFLCEGLSSFNLQRFYCSYVWSCSSYKKRACFCTGLISRKFCWLLLMFSTGFTSLSILLLFPLLITFIVMHSFFFYLSRSLYTIYCFANIIFWIVDDLAKRLFLHFSWFWRN